MSIEIFRDAANNAPIGSLDWPVYIDTQIGIKRFESSAYEKIYVNVPVDKIFALGRSDFCEEGQSWRQAVGNLTGDGWGAGTVQYFNGPIKESIFPAPSARFALQLGVIGGLCYCINGNHRLVAGRALLTNMQTEFQLVKVIYYDIGSHTRNFIASVVKSGAAVWTAKVESISPHSGRYDIYLQREDEPNVIYARSSIGIESLPDDRGFIKKAFSSRRLSSVGYDLVKTPTDVLAGLLDDKWIRSQAATATRW